MGASLDMNLSRWIDTWIGLLLCWILFLWSRAAAGLGGQPQPSMRRTTPPQPGAPSPRPRRILAIKLYGLGNIAMLLPTLGALRRAFPDAEIDFLSLLENRPLLERSGLARRVIGLEIGSLTGLLRSLSGAFLRIRRGKYDLVLDFEQFIKLSTILSYLSGAPERIGFNTDGQRRGWLYTTRVVYNDGEHMSKIFRRLLLPLGIDSTPARVEIRIEPHEDERVTALLADGAERDHARPIVALHVGSGPNFYRLALKRWPPESFGQLADALTEHFGATPVFTGKGPEEAALIEAATSGMRQPSINACDRLSIGELLSLLRRSDFVISNDTAVMHLANTVDTPVLAFFGPTDPLHYGPSNSNDIALYKGLYCSPCLTNYNLKVSYCSDPICIRTISVDEVLGEVRQNFFSSAAQTT